MEVNRLTYRAVEAIITRRNAERGRHHFLQIYEIRASPETEKPRKTMLFSDGRNCIRGVTTETATLREFDVIDLTEFRVTEFRGTTVVIADKLKVVFTGVKAIIGRPKEFSGRKSNEEEIDPIIPSTAIRLYSSDISKVNPQVTK